MFKVSSFEVCVDAAGELGLLSSSKVVVDGDIAAKQIFKYFMKT